MLCQIAWSTVDVVGMVLSKLNAHTHAEISNNLRFFLKVGVDRKPILDVTYAYYYQVQAQLKFCGANYCDFVASMVRGRVVCTKNLS